jgi:hypothetical protein
VADLHESVVSDVWSCLGGAREAPGTLHVHREGALPSPFAVTDLAVAAVGAAALAVADVVFARHGRRPHVRVDRRLASFWFASSIRPRGWRLPEVWDPLAGDYRTADGWIRLHTNAPHHRAAAERVLGAHADRAALAPVVERWCKGDLEAAIVAEGGCAAEMRSLAEWASHPQGLAVAAEPLVDWRHTEGGAAPAWAVPPERPLEGVRVLDLTRVLAGPVASRFLAAFGAEVLRIDPPHWNEPSIVPEVTLGKRCARLDLTTAPGRAVFEELLAATDVLLHGYRSDALARLGYDAVVRRSLRPGIVDVCLDAYGFRGPWAQRRGFDSLVQMSAGIADAGMRLARADRPVPLPVQALDHATGYFMAAAAARGLAERIQRQGGREAKLSLARTAKRLVDLGTGHASRSPFAPEGREDRAEVLEETPWGPARRLRPPVDVDGAAMAWSRPACELGSAAPRWE